MFAQLLGTTKTACSGRKARPFSIGIGLTDPRIAVAVASELAKNLGSPGVTLAVYHAEGLPEPKPAPDHVRWHPSTEPVHEMISDFNAGRLHAIIRGQLSSTLFLAELKQQFHMKRTYRLALLSTAAGQDFFFAPVGIDEGGDPRDKQHLIELAATLVTSIGITPSFYLLSAGRLDDANRGERIGASIRETIGLVDTLKQQSPPIAVQHGEILIENAFERGANTIIAPDGISGNLIYRTLLHLGSGHSHGAYYLGPGFPGPVMDTSRVGSVEEYAGAVVLALRLLTS